MAKLYNLARMTTATTGTGTITLGSAVSGYLTFALAGVSNLDIVSYAIKDGANSEIGTGTYTSAGTTLTRNVTKSTNSNTAITLSGTAEVFITARAEDLGVPPGYIFGLTLSAAGATATFGIALGRAADSTALDMMVLASAYTKTTATWAVGTGNGGIDTGAVAASTWYHVHLIKRQDTGVVDVLFSLSATAPTMPTNYTLFRRIGSMKTDGSSQWVKFFQNGETFLWDTPPTLDYSANNPGTAAVSVTLTLPTGVRTEAILNTVLINAAAVLGIAWYISSLDIADVAPVLTATSPLATMLENTTVSFQYASQIRVFTNLSAQIRSRINSSSTDITLRIASLGWVDSRGRFA